jgi:hypothetical protein
MTLYAKKNILTLYTKINIMTLYAKINIMTLYAKINIMTLDAKINILTYVDFNTISAVSWFIKILRSLNSFCLFGREKFSVLIFFQLIEHVENKKLKVVVDNIKPNTTTRNISNFQTKNNKYKQPDETCYLESHDSIFNI